MAESQANSKTDPKVAPQNEAGPDVDPTNAVKQDSNIYEMTLPFSVGEVSSECKARVVERTKERWSWFSHAQHMDKQSNARFGTLSYLPRETRRAIYDLLRFDQCTEHDPRFNRPDLLRFSQTFEQVMAYRNYSSDPTEYYISAYSEPQAGIFDFRFHNINCGNHCCTSRSLRLQHTSSSLRNEYRDDLLASSCFKLDHPAKVRRLLRSLAPHQELQLRRLTLNISVQDNLSGPTAHYEYAKYLGWRRICSQLPSTLTFVVLDAMNLNYHPEVRHYGDLPFYQAPFTHPGSKQQLKKLGCELLAADVICKGIKNRAPNAKFSVRMWRLVDPWYSAIFNAVLAEYNWEWTGSELA